MRICVLERLEKLINDRWRHARDLEMDVFNDKLRKARRATVSISRYLRNNIRLILFAHAQAYRYMHTQPLS